MKSNGNYSIAVSTILQSAKLFAQPRSFHVLMVLLRFSSSQQEFAFGPAEYANINK